MKDGTPKLNLKSFEDIYENILRGLPLQETNFRNWCFGLHTVRLEYP
jgi:hypothetical protein